MLPLEHVRDALISWGLGRVVEIAFCPTVDVAAAWASDQVGQFDQLRGSEERRKEGRKLSNSLPWF